MPDNVANITGGSEAKPASYRTFRKSLPPSTLTTEQGQRQTDVIRAACQYIAPNGSAIAFLNAHNETLQGIPLHIAIASDDGLLRVQNFLAGVGKAGR